jgi:hypothetical protein
LSRLSRTPFHRLAVLVAQTELAVGVVDVVFLQFVNDMTNCLRSATIEREVFETWTIRTMKEQSCNQSEL